MKIEFHDPWTADIMWCAEVQCHYHEISGSVIAWLECKQ